MKKILLGEKYADVLERPLIKNGFEPLRVPANPDIDARLAYHVDLSVFKYSDKKLIVARSFMDNAKLVNTLTNGGVDISPCENEQSADYPADASLCACVVGDRVIHSIKCSDPSIMALFMDKYINVKQGYSRCSVCVVDNNSIITSDGGIAEKARESGIDVLRIKPGGITLDGFDTGFIGGATFTAEKNVYFTGRPKQDLSEIVCYINRHNMNAVFLTDMPLFDIGGAIII